MIKLRNTPLYVLTLISVILPLGCSPKAAQTSAPTVDLTQAAEIFGATSSSPAQAQSPDTVVVVVQGDKITQADVTKEISATTARMQSRVPPERMAQMQEQIRQQALDTVVTRALLRHAVDDQKIAVTDADIDEAVAKIRDTIADGRTLEDFLALHNMDIDQFRKELALDLKVNKLLEGQTASIPLPSDADISAYYQENKERFMQPESVSARHILIAFQPGEDDAAKAAKKAKAEDLQARLAKGDDFAKAAEENSDDPGSKKQGGSLGPFVRGQMVEPFEEAAFSQKVGEVGPVVETRFGYHIILVEKHEEAREVPLSEVHDKLAEFLQNQKRQDAARDYVKSLRASAQITYPSGAQPAAETSAPPTAAP